MNTTLKWWDAGGAQTPWSLPAGSLGIIWTSEPSKINSITLLDTSPIGDAGEDVVTCSHTQIKGAHYYEVVRCRWCTQTPWSLPAGRESGHNLDIQTLKNQLNNSLRHLPHRRRRWGHCHILTYTDKGCTLLPGWHRWCPCRHHSFTQQCIWA